MVSSDDALSVRPFRSGDGDAVGRLIGHAFAVSSKVGPTAVEQAGPANARVICDGPEVVGTALLLPMGQFFGQRRVSMTGIAGVAVAPHAQRKGVATHLLRNALRELAGDGVGLSALFASNHGLYRKVGFECAGSRFRGVLDPRRLGVREISGTLLPMNAAGETRVRALYGAHGPSFPGFLDRSDYIWTRVLRPRGACFPTCVLASRHDGQVEGYISYSKRPASVGAHTIVVHDMLAVSAWGYRRLWSFLADLSTSVVRDVEFHTAPHDPARLVLPDAQFETSLSDTWMLRILDLDAALGQRGYPPRVEAHLDLDVYDDLVEDNNGPWRLRIAGGRGSVERGGAGELRTSIRGLAALYSGFANPGTLAAAGLIEGTPAALAIAGTVFGGSQPWMREMF